MCIALKLHFHQKSDPYPMTDPISNVRWHASISMFNLFHGSVYRTNRLARSVKQIKHAYSSDAETQQRHCRRATFRIAGPQSSVFGQFSGSNYLIFRHIRKIPKDFRSWWYFLGEFLVLFSDQTIKSQWDEKMLQMARNRPNSLFIVGSSIFH